MVLTLASNGVTWLPGCTHHLSLWDCALNLHHGIWSLLAGQHAAGLQLISPIQHSYQLSKIHMYRSSGRKVIYAALYQCVSQVCKPKSRWRYTQGDFRLSDFLTQLAIKISCQAGTISCLPVWNALKSTRELPNFAFLQDKSTETVYIRKNHEKK